jgi:hypothetical protein
VILIGSATSGSARSLAEEAEVLRQGSSRLALRRARAAADGAAAVLGAI